MAKWLEVAKKYRGLRETPGAANNPTIVNWLISLKAWWRDDATPWCGTFVAHCMREAGIEPAKAWYRAKAWEDWGNTLNFGQLAPGAVLVFDRKGGGHVGFYVGEDKTHFHVLGGNQGDAVNVMRLEKSRCVSARWPAGAPYKPAPVRLTATSAAVSKNEA